MGITHTYDNRDSPHNRDMICVCSAIMMPQNLTIAHLYWNLIPMILALCNHLLTSFLTAKMFLYTHCFC